MVDCHVIYFCHVPRTSGTSISNAVYAAFHKELRIYRKPDIEQFDPYYTKGIDKADYQSFLKDCYLNVDFFYGHHFSTPYIESYGENLETFSIIRNPLERSISEFYYINNNVSHLDWINTKIYEIKDFLLGKNLNIFNTQCLYLLGDYDWERMKRENGTVQIFWCNIQRDKIYHHTMDENKISFEELLQIIKKRNIKLSTLENRTYLLNELEISLNKIKKTNIVLDKQVIENKHLHSAERPEFDDPECFLSQEEIEKFKNINSLDYQLYNYIKDHETRTGRCLTPDDIDI
jgi:hypothetical protein